MPDNYHNGMEVDSFAYHAQKLNQIYIQRSILVNVLGKCCLLYDRYLILFLNSNTTNGYIDCHQVDTAAMFEFHY